MSLHRTTTYIPALTLFDTDAYTSFVNREVAKWLEQQQALKEDATKSRYDPTSTTLRRRSSA